MIDGIALKRAVIAGGMAAAMWTAGASSAHAGMTTDDMVGTHATSKTNGITGVSGLTAQDIVQTLMGTGITFSNAKITGAPQAFGRFTSDTADAFGFASGVVLSTGRLCNLIGPNVSNESSWDNYQPGDPALSALSGGTTFDAAVLEFDFVPTTDVFSFRYVFASEEYNEYVNSPFNDVIGLYVNGLDEAHDIALIPGTGTPVAINNINNGNPYGWNTHHPELYRNNAIPEGGGTIPTEMDGITVVLSAQAHVTAGALNHIRIAIADVGDSLYDSNVIIKAGSFSSSCIHFDALGKCDAVTPGATVIHAIEVGSPTNLPPVALCKTVYVNSDATCSGCGSVNNGSYDADGDTVTCVQAEQCYGVGENAVTLTCTDSHGLTSTCQGAIVVADATPPTMQCPANSTAECTLAGPKVIMPSGTGGCAGAVSTTCVGPPNGYFGYGADSVTCTATDPSGLHSSCTFVVNVVDTQKPVVAVSADGSGVSKYLWPPDHSYRQVTLADCVAAANDRCVGPLSLTTAGAFVKGYSDEAEDVGRGGDGHTCNDIVFVDNNTVQLREERQGGNTHTGRVYHLGYQIGDGHGNYATGTCVVDVVHDQSATAAPAIDTCGGKTPGVNCDLAAPHAGAYCVPGPGQSPAVCKGYGALHNPACNY